MKWDEISIGPCPAYEDAAQIGQPGFDELNRRECRAFIEAIRRVCGPEPDGAELFVKTESGSDFGHYCEVNVKFDPNDSRAVEYVYMVDEKAPTTWEDAQMTADEAKSSQWQSRFNGISRS